MSPLSDQATNPDDEMTLSIASDARNERLFFVITSTPTINLFGSVAICTEYFSKQKV
jgi:hypothetical protein